MYCCQIFLGQIQDEIEALTFAMSASGPRAQTHLFTVGGMQYCCWATLHQEINRYADIDYDQSHRSICTRQVWIWNALAARGQVIDMLNCNFSTENVRSTIWFVVPISTMMHMCKNSV